MGEGELVLEKMNKLLAGWQVDQDRRFIFLDCYKMMTENVIAAIEADHFEDSDWVAALMENFAGYYFQALDAFESGSGEPPDVWRVAFQAAGDSRTHVLQNLVLGVNAHINYDLVFALAEQMRAEWPELTHEGRQMRYRDFVRINAIIDQTISAVQSQIVERYEPLFILVDKALGPLDEWMTILLISEWREEVWKHATTLISPEETGRHEATRHLVGQFSLARARDILGKGGLHELAEFF